MLNYSNILNSKKLYWYIFLFILFIYLFIIDIILADAELVVAIALLIMIIFLYLNATNPIFTILNTDIYQIYQLIYNKFILLIDNFKYYFLNFYYYDYNLNTKLTLFINPIKSLIHQELNLLLTFELKLLETIFKSHLFYSLYNAKQYLNCSYLYKIFNNNYYIFNILYFGSIYMNNIIDINEKVIFGKKQFKQILLGFFLNEKFLNKLNYDQ